MVSYKIGVRVVLSIKVSVEEDFWQQKWAAEASNSCLKSSPSEASQSKFPSPGTKAVAMRKVMATFHWLKKPQGWVPVLPALEPQFRGQERFPQRNSHKTGPHLTAPKLFFFFIKKTASFASTLFPFSSLQPPSSDKSPSKLTNGDSPFGGVSDS